MPRITQSAQLPQYIAQNAPRGSVAGASPSSVDFRGLAAGVQSYQDSMDRLAQVNEQRRVKLDEEEAHSAVINTLSEARSKWTQRIAEAKNSATDPAGFTDSVLKEFDTWSNEQTKAAPDRGRKLLQQNLMELRGQINGRAFEFEMAARKHKVISDFGAGVDRDAATAFADPSQMPNLLAARLAQARTMNVPLADRDTMIAATSSKLAYSAASALVDRNPDEVLNRLGVAGQRVGKDGKPLPSDPKKAAEAVKSDPILMHLTPEQLRSVTDQATAQVVQRQALIAAERERQARAAEVAASQRAREQDRAFAIVSGRLANGIPTKPDAPEMRALAGSAYAGEVQRMLGELSARTAVALQPLPAQQQQLDELKARRFAGGTDAALEAEIKRREQVLAGGRKDFAESPLRAGAERGLYQVTPLDMTSMDSMAAGLQVRAKQADIAGRQAGKPASPMLPEEADRLAELLGALGPAQRAQRIAQIAGTMPQEMAGAIAKQIDGKDRTLALQFAAGAARTTEGRTVAELIGRGAQAIKDKGIKEDTSAEVGLKASLAKEFGTVLQGKDREDVLDAARLIYLGKQANGENVSFGGALKLALGGDIVEHNGARIPVVPGVDESRLSKALAAYPKAAIASQAPDGQVYVGGKAMPVDQFLAALPGATLEPASQGVYFVRSGGSRVQNAQRRAIRVEVR